MPRQRRIDPANSQGLLRGHAAGTHRLERQRNMAAARFPNFSGHRRGSANCRPCRLPESRSPSAGLVSTLLSRLWASRFARHPAAHNGPRSTSSRCPSGETPNAHHAHCRLLVCGPGRPDQPRSHNTSHRPRPPPSGPEDSRCHRGLHIRPARRDGFRRRASLRPADTSRYRRNPCPDTPIRGRAGTERLRSRHPEHMRHIQSSPLRRKPAYPARQCLLHRSPAGSGLRRMETRPSRP